MSGRIYRLRRNNRVNYFTPATYEDVGKLIGEVKKYDGGVNTVEIKTSDPTSISNVVYDILVHNGYTPKNVITGKDKVKFSIPGKVDYRSKVYLLVSKIKNDSIESVDFGSYSYPVGTSRNGVKVPLKGYTKAQADSGDKGVTAIQPSAVDSSDATAGSPSINWYLIGAAVLVGAVIVIAVVKSMKK